MSDEKKAAERTPTGGLRVLVVNVRSGQAKGVLEQLAVWGAAGEAAADINQALVMLQDAAAVGRPYRVAIVDLPIGVFGADEFGQIISHSVGARKTRYLLTTTPDHAPTRQQLANSVFCASIVKPITQAKLADALFLALGSGSKAPARPAAASAADRDPFPPIDVNEVIKHCHDDLALMAGLMETFQTNACREVEQMIQGLREHDAAGVARSAHALMAAAAALTARRVHDAAAHVGRLGSANDFDGAHCQIQRLQDELERLKTYVCGRARSGMT